MIGKHNLKATRNYDGTWWQPNIISFAICRLGENMVWISLFYSDKKASHSLITT